MPGAWGGLLLPGRPASTASVARAIGQVLGEPMAPDQSPSWLGEGQRESFSRLLHLLRRDGAALCADPVGSGKTYIALAVAHALAVGVPCCIAPPTLVAQWLDVAQRLGVPLTAWSHAKLSRGSLPPGDPGLVFLDESHHFRNPMIRRYRTLAPWLVGRKLLLLSATPVVNTPRDLYYQLHLGLRDDVLAQDGSPSLRLAFASGEVPAALCRHVVERVSAGGRPPARESRNVLASGALPSMTALDELRLSDTPAIAALLRVVFLRAAASSAAALQAALHRYRLLLLQARDAEAAGHAPSRRGLRGLLSGAGEQLLMWELLAPETEGDALRLDEIPRLDRLLADLRELVEVADEKSAWLRTALRDGLPTLVFVSNVETARFLRRQLPDPWLAWCTGRQSGIGRVAMPRGDVLDWFRPGAPVVPGRPTTLVATDVGAEGLDLQRAVRVVHYDLPWTEVRLTQREGRAIRMGSGAAEVLVHRLLPPAEIEIRLRQEAVLLGKAGLPAACGLGSEGRGRWRWRRELATLARGPACEGVAAVRCDPAGWLACVALESDGERVAATALWRPVGGAWTDDPTIVEPRLLQAMEAPEAPPPSAARVAEAVSTLEPLVREMLRAASLNRREGVQPTASSRAMGRRLRALASGAARQRDRESLARLDTALAFTAGGHTAGEEALIAELLHKADAGFMASLPSLPRPSPPVGPATPRLVGLVEFVPPVHGAP